MSVYIIWFLKKCKQNKTTTFLDAELLWFRPVWFFTRKRDPIMMHSLVKYSVMELQKSIQHDIMEKLNEHTEATGGVVFGKDELF